MPAWWSRSPVGTREIRVLDLKEFVKMHPPEGGSGGEGDGTRRISMMKVSKSPEFYVVPCMFDSKEIKGLMDICAANDGGWQPSFADANCGTSEFLSLGSLSVAGDIAECV